MIRCINKFKFNKHAIKLNKLTHRQVFQRADADVSVPVHEGTYSNHTGIVLHRTRDLQYTPFPPMIVKTGSKFLDGHFPHKLCRNGNAAETAPLLLWAGGARSLVPDPEFVRKEVELHAKRAKYSNTRPTEEDEIRNQHSSYPFFVTVILELEDKEKICRIH